jgi:hypothetical protein
MRHSPLESLSVCDNVIHISAEARNIGVLMDSTLYVEQHVANICKTCFYHLCSAFDRKWQNDILTLITIRQTTKAANRTSCIGQRDPKRQQNCLPSTLAILKFQLLVSFDMNYKILYT